MYRSETTMHVSTCCFRLNFVSSSVESLNGTLGVYAYFSTSYWVLLSKCLVLVR